MLVQSYIVQGSDEGPFYLGKAVGPNDNVIGYNLMVQFPVSNYSGLTGNDNEGTPARAVSVKNVAKRRAICISWPATSGLLTAASPRLASIAAMLS